MRMSGLRFKFWKVVIEFRKEERQLGPKLPELSVVILHRDESWMAGSKPWPRIFSISFDFRHIGAYIGERNISVYWFESDWRPCLYLGWFGFGDGRSGASIAIGVKRWRYLDKNETTQAWAGPIRFQRWEEEPSPSEEAN